MAKALSNGSPMTVVLGEADIIDAAQTSFTSNIYWIECIDPAALIATIKKMREKNVPAHLIKIARLIGEGWEKFAKEHAFEQLHQYASTSIKIENL